MIDAIGEIDLNAYVDNELDEERRAQVEAYLARHPDMAARVMHDLHAARLLRLALRDHPCPSLSSETMAGAVQLKRALSGRRRMPLLAMAAVLLATLIPLPLPHSPRYEMAAATPTYLDDAIRAHRTAIVRGTMRSQPQTPHFDAQEVRRATRIRLPRLPEDWRIRDVQIIPAAEGPALFASIATAEGHVLFLFAVHAASTAPAQPTAISHGGVNIAYWQEERTSFAVIGDASVSELDRIADDLEDNDLV